MIKLEKISKTYKTKRSEVEALTNISLTVKKGRVAGLIGPNGAGKSTLVKIIVGILQPSSGLVRVADKIPYRERQELAPQLGVMFGNRSSLIFQLPLIDSVLLMKDIYDLDNTTYRKRLDEYVSILGLADLLDKRVREMSLGQRIKSELLITLLHNPKILIFDEPTLGLDIIAKQSFRNILRNLAAKEGKTIVITSHDLVDIEQSCDDVFLINKGELLQTFERKMFEHEISAYRVLTVSNDIEIPAEIRAYLRESNDLKHKLFLPKGDLDMVINAIRLTNGADINFEVSSPNLEDMVYENYKVEN
ncbi:MAG: ATP-binding cassette domain-containing protein [Eubacteriales bacterium]|nr:ATP-binding cassette domain-containing protein [Eubacteriales bacterium]